MCYSRNINSSPCNQRYRCKISKSGTKRGFSKKKWHQKVDFKKKEATLKTRKIKTNLLIFKNIKDKNQGLHT